MRLSQSRVWIESTLEQAGKIMMQVHDVIHWEERRRFDDMGLIWKACGETIFHKPLPNEVITNL